MSKKYKKYIFPAFSSQSYLIKKRFTGKKAEYLDLSRCFMNLVFHYLNYLRFKKI